jgi:hypothetical protein
MGSLTDFKWRHQPRLDSDNAKLLSYIQNKTLHRSQDKTALIINALTAYYLPLALYSEGNYSRERLELVFFDSVNAIANHLKYLCTVIQVEEAKVNRILYSAFGGVATEVDNSQKLAPYQMPTPDTEDEVDNFELQMWNLAGITTDSEIF